MTWFNASEHFAIGAATRHRVQELRSTASLAIAHDGAERDRTAGSTRTLCASAALVLGLIGLVAASCIGCAGPRSVAVDAGVSASAATASSPVVAPQIPVCRGMGSYNRAANLCVSEGM